MCPAHTKLKKNQEFNLKFINLAIGKSNDKNYVIVGIVVAILVFSVIACCFCYKIRKGSDGQFERFF